MSEQETFKTYTWAEHFQELRNRLLFALIPFLIIFGISYANAPFIYDLLVHPLKTASQDATQKLIYTGLTEAFISYIKIALWTAFFITCPLFILQFWKFITPGLYRTERRKFTPYLFCIPLFFYMGAALAYFYIFPMAWEFFLSFEQSHSIIGLPIHLEAKMSEYLSLSMTLLIAFGLSFEFPLVLLLCHSLGVISYNQLKNARKYVIVMIFIAAAILTPPDIVSQIGLAIPLMLFYESSLLWIKFREKTQRNMPHVKEKTS